MEDLPFVPKHATVQQLTRAAFRQIFLILPNSGEGLALTLSKEPKFEDNLSLPRSFSRTPRQRLVCVLGIINFLSAMDEEKSCHQTIGLLLRSCS